VRGSGIASLSPEFLSIKDEILPQSINFDLRDSEERPFSDWWGVGSRDGAVVSGFDSQSRGHMWAEFVLGSRPCSEGFSPGFPVFLPPQKPTFPNSIWNQWTKSHSVEMSLQNSNLFQFQFQFVSEFSVEHEVFSKQLS